MRIDPEDLRHKPLRVHTFLADVPLHDVWAIRLEGGGAGRTLPDFQALFSAESLQRANLLVRGLFRLRWELGRLFGWEREKDAIPASSYVHRLGPKDRAGSLETPGAMNSRLGPFRVVYAFENESLHEIINLTAHAFSLMAMEPAPHGYTVYWAVYVKRVSWLTPVYMALIDPFRRFLVYPAVVRKLERAWREAYGTP